MRNEKKDIKINEPIKDKKIQVRKQIIILIYSNPVVQQINQLVQGYAVAG
jgi:hypothetical protein